MLDSYQLIEEVIYALVISRSSSFARLLGVQCSVAGKNLYMRFSCSTGDAMGMNMVSKGVENVLQYLKSEYEDMDVIGISGRFITACMCLVLNLISLMKLALFIVENFLLFLLKNKKNHHGFAQKSHLNFRNILY